MSAETQIFENSPSDDRLQTLASEKFLLYFNFGLLTLLTLFGTTFSKFHLIGPLYLHDFLLLVGAMLGLFLKPRGFMFWPVKTLLIISSAYLIYSIFHSTAGLSLVVRQFAIFGYMGLYYFLNRQNPLDHSELIERFLIIFSFTAFVLQLLHVIYLVLFGKFDPFDFHNHYWYSPLTVVGLIVSTATVLLYVKSLLLRLVLLAGVIMLSWTTGHASAILAVLSILGAYLILVLERWKKVLPIIGGAVLITLLMSFLPQFKDKNSDWRILTWGYLLRELTTNNYMVIGKGFGTPYFTVKMDEYLFKEISSTAIQERGKPDERYLSPPHNSFMTILFSIGILPGLMIFAPYLYVVRDLGGTIKNMPRLNSLLMLSLIGQTTWAGFNVVLELPHSAGLFWFVYFMYWSLQRSPGSFFRSKPSDQVTPLAQERQ